MTKLRPKPPNFLLATEPLDGVRDDSTLVVVLTQNSFDRREKKEKTHLPLEAPDQTSERGFFKKSRVHFG